MIIPALTLVAAIQSNNPEYYNKIAYELNFDKYFTPYNNLTRAQMAKVLMRSLRISYWY